MSLSLSSSAINFEPVIDLLSKFIMPVMDFKRARILKIEQLSPDSAGFLLSTNENKLYVLYIEDFIESLDAVQKHMEEFFPSKVLAFMKPKDPQAFEDTPGAQYYLKPNHKEIDKWVEYTVPYHGDYAFLALIEPTKANQSYWATRKVYKLSELPPEIQKLLPPDPERPFLDEWMDRRKSL